MSTLNFILSSARHYAKAHLGLLFGVFLASAILSGSLLVGDSVKASLRRVAELRLGRVGAGMIGGERWFTEELAKKCGSVPMIIATGSVSAATGTSRVNAAQVLGINDSFWNLSPSSKPFAIGSGEVLLNESMARKLGAKKGDAVIVRMEKPSALSRDAPLSGSTDSDIALRRTVAGIIRVEDFGAFQLQASQIGADTAFIGMKDLQGQMEMEGRCNAMFADGVRPLDLIDPALILNPPTPWNEFKTTFKSTPAAMLHLLVGQAPSLEDYALKLRRLTADKPEWELSTDRVFIDDPIATKLTKHLPESQGVLTYLVNGISSKTGATPYSMVTATDAFPSGIRNSKSEIVVTQWLADDLGIKAGDKVDMRYFVVGIGRELKEQTASFTLSAIIPMNDPRVSRDWTPAFPGVSDVDNCRDWDPGFTMDKKAIREKDEKYWDDYKGTPKAFISLEAGQQLWGNRFGQLTAIRFTANDEEAKLRETMTRRLKLGDIGLQVQDFKAQAAAAAKGSVDFGGLFAGLSMFLIGAALVFAALLFIFLIERRASQAGLLMAVGWSPKMVRRALLLEAGVIALIGSALGLLGGIAYTKAALAGLEGAWGDATAGLPLIFDAQPMTILIAFVASFGIAIMTLWWMTRRLLKAQPRELLSNGGIPAFSIPTKTARMPMTLIVALLSVIAAIALVIFGQKLTNPQALAGSFFGAGTLLMTSALALAKHWMNAQARSTTISRSLWQIGLRNVTRRPGRSLAILGMMAGGIFLVVAVNAFRLTAGADATKRDSGTGGFALIGESSLAIYEDLNTKTGRDAFGLDEEDMHGATVLPFRMRPGDDASCLNLNRAQNPQLVGVNTARLSELKAFSFASGNWDDLKFEIRNSKEASIDAQSSNFESRVLEIPAACDQATAMWGLQKGVGDVIEYDLGGGKKLRVKLVALLAGSVLQGKVIIDERVFIDRLPDVSGYRFFLVDVAPEKAREVSETLTKQLQPRGLALEPTAQRLNAFSAVQNTYIGIFTVLGGLGVLLGTAGIGVLVARHVMERRGELGLMQAVGFLPAALRRLVVGEHGALLVVGLVVGVVSAAVAVWPGLTRSAQELPLPFISALVLAILVCGLGVCFISAAMALRGRLVDAVRRE